MTEAQDPKRSQASRLRRPRGQKRFLEALAITANVRASCLAGKVTRSAVYVWRDRDERFRAEWESALDEGLDRIEMSGFASAVEGNPHLIQFFLSRRRPEMYGRHREMLGATDAFDRRPQLIIIEAAGDAPGEHAPPQAEAE